ncbi:MAG: hypothetical protein E7307_00450 [Butyrivibrio sp.]|nr:hypothetical protein [Butyrivibrio sp.]
MKRLYAIVPIILISLLIMTGCGSKSTVAESDDSFALSSSEASSEEVTTGNDSDPGKEPETEADLDPGKESEAEADLEASREYSVQPAEDEDEAPDPSAAVDPKIVITPSSEVDSKIMLNPPAPSAMADNKMDYGRIIFAGDSRTVDIFDASRGEIFDETHDGIRVFCKHGCRSDYMINAVNSVGYDNFDTLISWMGCNDLGDFSPYAAFYEEVLANGKNLILCTVGPTDDATLVGEFDQTYYTNDHQIAYNNALMDWASQHSTVNVIPLYDYINREIANGNLYIDPNDGIHYQPQPTGVIWEKILKEIG